MNVQDIVAGLPVVVVTGKQALTNQVTGGYTSDLLSNVMGQATNGNIWVTMQGHQNIAAVASLAGLAAVVIAGGAEPAPETLQKAEQEGIVILTTALSTFEVVGRLYEMGVRGA